MFRKSDNRIDNCEFTSRVTKFIYEENILVNDENTMDKIFQFIRLVTLTKQNPDKIITLGVRNKSMDTKPVMWNNHYNKLHPHNCDNSPTPTPQINHLKPTSQINHLKQPTFTQVLKEHNKEVSKMQIDPKSKKCTKDSSTQSMQCIDELNSKQTQTESMDKSARFDKLMEEINGVKSKITRLLEPYDEIQFNYNIMDVGLHKSLLKAIEYFVSKVEAKTTIGEMDEDVESIMDPIDDDDHECDSD